MINSTVIYNSIRQEIMDVKKCQFNIFCVSITFTAAILAYAASTKVGPLVYIAPILMNVLCLTIILDKVVGIQRMVGYLQLMESGGISGDAMWEFHLSKFRELTGKSCGSEEFRKHKYIITVSSIILLINFLSGALYRWGPSAIALRNETDYYKVSEFYGAINLLVSALLALGVLLAIRKWWQLVFGIYTGKAIKDRWSQAIQASNEDLS